VRKRLCHVVVGAVQILIFLVFLACLENVSGGEESIRLSEHYTTNLARVAALQPYFLSCQAVAAVRVQTALVKSVIHANR